MNKNYYPWYQIVEKSEKLEQGDIIFEFPVIIPPDEFDNQNEINIKIEYHNIIIMSQSCDLVNNKIKNVVVCPIYSLAELGEKFKSNKNKENLRKGKIIRFHLLNKCELELNNKEFLSTFKNDFIVVDFSSILSINFQFLINFAYKKDRLRLLPPYREHLAQSFARFFMRIGLPIDIPEFK